MASLIVAESSNFISRANKKNDFKINFKMQNEVLLILP